MTLHCFICQERAQTRFTRGRVLAQILDLILSRLRGPRAPKETVFPDRNPLLYATVTRLSGLLKTN